MAKTFVIHDESLNSQGFWMLTAGCDLTQFQKNPIMLFNHNRSSKSSDQACILPIGHWENVRTAGTQILADAVFDSDPFAQTIAMKVKSGTLRMASIGVQPLETSSDPSMIKLGQCCETVTSCKVKEASIVDIGANDNALAMVALYDTNGLVELSDEGESPIKKLETNTNPNKNEMKAVNMLLNLADTADEKAVLAALEPLINLRDELNKEKTEKEALQNKLDAIELSEKEARRIQAIALVDAAFKDGRLDNDKNNKTRESWINLFDTDFATASTMLDGLPKHQSVAIQLNDMQPSNAWEKRQEEIEKKNK